MGIDLKVDEDLEGIVGRQCDDSGSGFGYRDMGWQDVPKEDYDSLNAAILKRVPNAEVGYRDMEEYSDGL